ncbi:Uncharacterised protein [Salmonella enterica subsp. arizonae]|uniref:Uncharacterized protein n=1 Tax=Salmonella enterica subsp. arizonae TaxID=59203 RepID=A0A379SU77_SALER|nr:Uncharacterised protein [Salmonella enterica subsp. arizonae]
MLHCAPVFLPAIHLWLNTLSIFLTLFWHKCVKQCLLRSLLMNLLRPANARCAAVYASIRLKYPWLISLP